MCIRDRIKGSPDTCSEYSKPRGAPPRFLLRFPPDQEITSWRYLMARHLFAILDDLTANLAELKAALAPLVLIGGTVVSEASRPATTQRSAKGAPSGGPAGLGHDRASDQHQRRQRRLE